MNEEATETVDEVVEGEATALARAITWIENRTEGHRELLNGLHSHGGGSHVVGVTGAPGSGKSTLVDEMTSIYRDRGLTVGVIAVDPSSPYTGGAVLGDRIRMGGHASDDGVFVRSMSARGSLGGLSTAASDAVRAFDAAGFDRVILETVGTGQNEVDVVRAADSVAVLVTPEGGDAVQTLKAGILEIADVFVVNKADRRGADRTVKQLQELVGDSGPVATGHHGDEVDRGGGWFDEGDRDAEGEGWTPTVLDTVAKTGEGVEDVVDELDEHRRWLTETEQGEAEARRRVEMEIRNLVRQRVHSTVERGIRESGDLEEVVDEVVDGDLSPYDAAEDVVDSFLPEVD